MQPTPIHLHSRCSHSVVRLSQLPPTRVIGGQEPVADSIVSFVQFYFVHSITNPPAPSLNAHHINRNNHHTFLHRSSRYLILSGKSNFATNLISHPSTPSSPPGNGPSLFCTKSLVFSLSGSSHSAAVLVCSSICSLTGRPLT